MQCVEKEERDVSLNIKLRYDDQALVMGANYTYPDGKAITFTRVSFFISDLSLNGSESESILDAAFINPTIQHQSEAGATEGLTFPIGKTTVTSPNNLTFNLGLTPDQNATVPADYASGETLARPGEYWIAWKSYVFAKIEGFIDMDGNGEPETGISLHMGSDEARRLISLSGNVNRAIIPIEIDIRKVFGTTDIYDIEGDPQIHSLSQLPQTNFLVDNLKSSFEIK